MKQHKQRRLNKTELIFFAILNKDQFRKLLKIEGEIKRILQNIKLNLMSQY